MYDIISPLWIGRGCRGMRKKQSCRMSNLTSELPFPKKKTWTGCWETHWRWCGSQHALWVAVLLMVAVAVAMLFRRVSVKGSLANFKQGASSAGEECSLDYLTCMREHFWGTELSTSSQVGGRTWYRQHAERERWHVYDSRLPPAARRGYGRRNHRAKLTETHA